MAGEIKYNPASFLLATFSITMSRTSLSLVPSPSVPDSSSKALRAYSQRVEELQGLIESYKEMLENDGEALSSVGTTLLKADLDNAARLSAELADNGGAEEKQA